MRGKLDQAAAGQQQIVELLTGLISGQGDQPERRWLSVSARSVPAVDDVSTGTLAAYDTAQGLPWRTGTTPPASARQRRDEPRTVLGYRFPNRPAPASRGERPLRGAGVGERGEAGQPRIGGHSNALVRVDVSRTIITETVTGVGGEW